MKIKKMKPHALSNEQAFKNSTKFKKWVKGDIMFCKNIWSDVSPEWVVISKWNGLYDINRFYPAVDSVSQELGRVTEKEVFEKLYELSK